MQQDIRLKSKYSNKSNKSLVVFAQNLLFTFPFNSATRNLHASHDFKSQWLGMVEPSLNRFKLIFLVLPKQRNKTKIHL